MNTKLRVLAAKIETTPGTAEALAAADGAFNVYDLIVQVDPEFETREGQGSFSSIPGVAGGRKATMTFKVDWTGSGTPDDGAGEAVAQWQKTFFPACSWVQGAGANAKTFSRKSEHPSAAGGVKSLTMGCYINGKKKCIRGAVGDAVIHFPSHKKAFVEFTFLGIWSPVTNVAILSPEYPPNKPRVVEKTLLAIGANYTPRVAEIVINLGNVTTIREDGRGDGGYYCGAVTDSKVNGTLDAETELTLSGILDPYNAMYGSGSVLTGLASGLPMTFGWGGSGLLGSGANGHHTAFSLPRVQLKNIQEGDREGILIDNWEFQANRRKAAGEDEMTFTMT